MTFELIYQTNHWNGEESLSGPGSGSAATSRVIPWLRRIVQEEAVLSILDVGCGDGFWMPDLTAAYVGIDPSPTAIERSRERHPHRTYVVGDASTFDLPMVEMVIIRDVIQHLSQRDGLALLENVKRARPYLLLASTYVGMKYNDDIETGDTYSPDLTLHPFDLGQPELLVFDGYHYHHHDTGQVRDPAKYLGLWRLR